MKAKLYLTAAALLMSASMVLAAEASGSVKSVSEKSHEVVMDNGQTYVFSAKEDLSKVKAGEKVKITYETKGGKHEATAISPAS